VGLAHACQGVRADARTARSRILIIAPDAEPLPADAVEPDDAVPAPLAAVARVAAPSARLSAGRVPAGDPVRQVGDRLGSLAADLDQLLREAERERSSLEEELDEGSRARLRQHSRVLGEIGRWTRAVADDLRNLAAKAHAGIHRVDLADVLADAIAESAASPASLPAALAWAGPGAEVEIDPRLGVRLVAEAMRLLSIRLGGRGSIVARVEPDDAGVVRMHLEGRGEPCPVQDADGIARLLDAARALGIALEPGAGGPAGAGLVLVFPAPPF
jgi:hypothetical protein